MLTYKKVNAELQKLDPTAELVKSIKGDYHYFLGDSIRYSYTTSVMVPQLNNLRLETWVFEFKLFQEESKRRGRSSCQSKI